MKIVVIGCGKVGKEIIKLLCKEGHEIIAVDISSDVIHTIVETYDVSGFIGNGAALECQKEVIDNKTDLVIAVTERDEVNILACVSAKKLGAKRTIARIRNHDYSKDADWLSKEFEIDLVVNPELETAWSIRNFLIFPEALRVDILASGKVDLVEFCIKKDNPLIGKNLITINKDYGVQILVCAVQRDNDVFIPDGNYTFQENDRIHVTASRSMMKAFFNKLGLMEDTIKKVMIIGGGKLGVYLAELLLKAKYEVKLIEKNHARCEEISQVLPQVNVICGDGSEQDILKSENILDMDAVVCLTGLDEENIIIGMYASQIGISKVVTKINNSSFEGMLSTVMNIVPISPKKVSAAKIVSFSRSQEHKFNNKMENLYMLVNNKVEVSEFIASTNDHCLNIDLKSLPIKKGFLIATIIRNNDVIIPTGSDMILEGDRVIIVTSDNQIDELSDILK